MPTLTPSAVLFHVPKTGGTWATHAVLSAAKRAERRAAQHLPARLFGGVDGRLCVGTTRTPGGYLA